MESNRLFQRGSAEYVTFCKLNTRKYQHPTREDLRAIFSLTELDTIKIKSRYAKSKKQEHEKRHAHLASLRIKAPKSSKFIYDELLHKANKCAEKYTRQIQFLRARKSNIENPSLPQRKVPIDKEDVKDFPIRRVLELHNIPIINNKFFKLREERTPSCYLYEDSNSYYDFGASTGGDVIDLYMKLSGATFSQAVCDLSTI